MLKKYGKDSRAVCLLGVETNSIFYDSCSNSIRIKCSFIVGTLNTNPTSRCKRCTGPAMPVDGRPMTEVTMGREKPEVVPSIYCPSDCLSSGCDFELASITRYHAAWCQFNESLPILTSRPFPISCRGRVYNSFSRSEMPHATSFDLHHLQHNDWTAIRWMSSVTTKDQVSLQDLLVRMQPNGVEDISILFNSDGIAISNAVMVGLKKSRNSIPEEVVALVTLRKNWSEMVCVD